MIPKVIHFIWLGSELPDRFAKNIETFREMNPDWQIMLWDQQLLEVEGWNVDAWKERFWSYASVSNYARLCVIERFGGFYFDVDFKCLKPLNWIMLPFDSPIACDQGDGRICNAAFAAKPGDKWVQWQLEKVNMNCHPHDAAWGVYTMTEAVRCVGCNILNPEVFYPYRWDSQPDDRKIKSGTIAVHEWEGSWVTK